MVLVVVDTELLLDDAGDAGAGPDVTAEAVGLRPVPEELWDHALLGGREFGRVAWRGPCQERLGTAVAGGSEPTADGLLGDAQGIADLTLAPALLFQKQRPQPPPLSPVNWDEVRCVHPPILRSRKLDVLCAAVSNRLLSEASLDPSELAALLGRTEVLIYKYLQGVHLPKLHDLPELAQALNLKSCRDLIPQEWCNPER